MSRTALRHMRLCARPEVFVVFVLVASKSVSSQPPTLSLQGSSVVEAQGLRSSVMAEHEPRLVRSNQTAHLHISEAGISHLLTHTPQRSVRSNQTVLSDFHLSPQKVRTRKGSPRDRRQEVNSSETVPETAPAVNTEGLPEGMTLDEGRCDSKTDMQNQYAACSSNIDSTSCLNNTDCTWKLINDTLNFTCYCSFSGCKCGDPTEGFVNSRQYDQTSMLMVVIPVAIGCCLVCTGFLTHWQRENLAWLFGILLPDSVLKQFEIKDDDVDTVKRKKAQDKTTLIEEDGDENEFKKALEAWENAGLPPPKEFTLCIRIERCLNLPIMDVAFRDAHMCGSCDPYVKMTVGGQSQQTSVLKGTLYPVFDEDFEFFIDRDHLRRRPQQLLIEVFDYDFFKKDDYVGQVSLPVAKLLKAYADRKDRQSPYTNYYRLPLKDQHGKVIKEPTDRTGHKKGHAPPSELHFRIEIFMSYDMRQSVADMRRAINYIRTTNMARDEAHQESLKNVRGVAWDDHTNTKRWQHTATNLGGDRGHGADAESEITEEAEGVARSGVRGSKFAVDRLPPGQTSGRKGRMRLAEHFRKNYDLWGLRDVVDDLQNPFLRHATDVRANQLRGLELAVGDYRPVDEQLQDALFLEDTCKLTLLLEQHDGSPELRAQARLMVKKGARREEESFAVKARAAAVSEEEARGAGRTLVCICQPNVFVEHGRCVCGFEQMLSPEMRSETERQRAQALGYAEGARMAAAELELLEDKEGAVVGGKKWPPSAGRGSTLSSPRETAAATDGGNSASLRGHSHHHPKGSDAMLQATTPITTIATLPPNTPGSATSVVDVTTAATPQSKTPGSARAQRMPGLVMDAVLVREFRGNKAPGSSVLGTPHTFSQSGSSVPGPYNAQRREHAAGARNRWKEEQKAKKMALQEQKAVRKNARSQAQQLEQGQAARADKNTLTVSVLMPKGPTPHEKGFMPDKRARLIRTRAL